VFDGLVEVVLLTLGRNMEHMELIAKQGGPVLKNLMGPRDLLAWEGEITPSSDATIPQAFIPTAKLFWEGASQVQISHA